jgi:hypothetical protein
MTVCGSRFSRSTGLALSGNQPLFDVNHSATFQGDLQSSKASSTAWMRHGEDLVALAPVVGQR